MLSKWLLDAMFWKINMAKDSRDNYSELPFQGLAYNQGFKFRFGSHFGLDIETEYFVCFGLFRCTISGCTGYIYIEYYIT